MVNSMVDIKLEIERLLSFGYKKKLLEKADIIPARNSLLDLFNLDEIYEGESFLHDDENVIEVLNRMLDYAYENGILKSNSDTYRDLLDARIMGLIMPRASEVANKFWLTAVNRSITDATKDYYEMSKASNYIRIDRIKKNEEWKSSTEYGDIEITINLSKPEKDPKAIEEAKNSKDIKYPKCLLCLENVGYSGRADHYARQNHRVIPTRLGGEQWYFQYSPYVYYNEHCIIFSEEHRPMKIGEETFRRMFDFIDQFPHYFIGSNADLPIVGGSILSHDHFQGGRYEFPMAKAEIEKYFESDDSDIEIGIVKWPMSVIRLRSKNYKKLVEEGTAIHKKWQNYSDEENEIFAYSGEEPHNTVTPIARKKGEYFEFDIVLRNNRTSREYPLGIFHPHKELHHIKKENIGLIEVMGLAILPGRLKKELAQVAEVLRGKENEIDLSNHKQWIGYLREKYKNNLENIEEKIKMEVSYKFKKVLEHAGVYKRDENGIRAFDRFMKSLGYKIKK